MKRLASILGVAAALGAPAAHAQTPLVSNYPANITTNFTATGTNERGIAYGVVDSLERLYMTSRQGGGIYAYIYDANTGAWQAAAGDGTGSLNTTGITGGTVPLQDIEVTDDGAIYGCNLAVPGEAFKCYYWASEEALPVSVVFVNPPPDANRLGDKVRVTGSLASGINLWAVSTTAGALALYRCTATAYAAFTCTTHDLSGAGIVGISNGVASPNPGSTTRIWINGNGVLPRLVTIPETGDGAATAALAIPQAQLNGTGNNSIYAFRNQKGDSTYVAMYEYNTTSQYHRARIVNVTPMTTATPTTTGVRSWSITPSVGTVSSVGFGDIAIREPNPSDTNAVVFVLGPNNSFGSFRTTTAGLPVELTSFTASADGATARFAWTTASETNNAAFALEQRTGATWTERFTTAGRGTTSERATYSADVEGLAPGRHTFRLRQTDLDGTSTIAGTVTVEIAPESGLAIVLLGDGQGGTHAVRIASRAAQPVTAHLYDVTGRQVAMLVSGETGATVDATLPSGLAAGVYVVRAVSGSASVTRTLVVR